MKIISCQYPSDEEIRVPVTSLDEYEQSSVNELTRLRVVIEEEAGDRLHTPKISPLVFQGAKGKNNRMFNVYKATSGKFAGRIFQIRVSADILEWNRGAILMRENVLSILSSHLGASRLMVVSRSNLELIHENVQLGTFAAMGLYEYTRITDQQERAKLEYGTLLASEYFSEYRIKLGLITNAQHLRDLPEPLSYVLNDGSLISTEEIATLVEENSVEEAFKILAK